MPEACDHCGASGAVVYETTADPRGRFNRNQGWRYLVALCAACKDHPDADASSPLRTPPPDTPGWEWDAWRRETGRSVPEQVRLFQEREDP